MGVLKKSTHFCKFTLHMLSLPIRRGFWVLIEQVATVDRYYSRTGFPSCLTNKNTPRNTTDGRLIYIQICFYIFKN
jgi:hypothetical protein